MKFEKYEKRDIDIIEFLYPYLFLIFYRYFFICKPFSLKNIYLFVDCFITIDYFASLE